MIYVIDTSVISALYKNYYRANFPSLWKLFDAMVDAGRFSSCREALRELEDRGGNAFDWAKSKAEIFVPPDAKDGDIVAQIYAVQHFQANIDQKKLQKGGKCADPFLVARAHTVGGTVLTMEQPRPHAAKIPNICDHFKIPCVDLQKFMSIEKWHF